MSPAQPLQTSSRMHIIIVGGGPAGLTAYLSLKQSLPSETKFTILERHKSDPSSASQTFAGALGIAPNGLRVLKHISPSLFDKVRQAGCETKTFRFQTAGGWTLGHWNATSQAKGEEIGTVMIERRRLWDVLRAEVPADVIREGAKVIYVRSDGVVMLEDAEELRGDLVIGADGIRSLVRKTVIDEGEPGRNALQTTVMDVGGYVPAAYIREANASSTTMTFGNTGFVGYAITSTDASANPGAIWWSTYHGHSTDANEAKTPDDPQLVKQLAERHGDWSDPVIKRLLSDLNEKNPSSGTSIGFAAAKVSLAPLSRWSKNRIFLVGDAAHALPSSSGQGVSMAFEDVFVLSQLLEQEVDDTSQDLDAEELEEIGTEYYRLRNERVNKVRVDGERSQAKKATMSIFEAAIMYTILWTLMKLGVGDSWKTDYDVAKLFEEEET